MKAGRELDALVAEKVMGLTVRPVRVIDHRGVSPDIGTVSAPYRMRDGREGVKAQSIPHYSTGIAAAWQVVEKVRERRAKWCFTLEDVGESDAGPDSWRAEFFSNYAYALTAPHAICLAALKALDK